MLQYVQAVTRSATVQAAGLPMQAGLACRYHLRVDRDKLQMSGQGLRPAGEL